MFGLGLARTYFSSDDGSMEVLELRILEEAAILGTFYPKGQYDKERAPVLAEAGYLRPVRRPVGGVGFPPPPVGYEITSEGKAILAANRSQAR
jgi:hypothetical protein